WSKIRSKLDPGIISKINEENRRDIISIFFAVPWQITLFLTGMMIVLKQWSNFFILLSIFSLLSIGLYWFWFRHLSKEVKI
ncbi:MAG: sodium:solute symporter, partial [Bacteroidetes bacterium]|nr:sodium:solute symporter [Bacteroidota bacterium]